MREREPSLDDGGERPNKRSKLAADRNEFGFMRRSVGEGTANFIGSASGIHFVRSVYNAAQNTAANSDASRASPDDSAVPGEEDHLATSTGAAKPSMLWRPLETSIVRLNESLRYDDLLSWSQSYWDYWHPSLPFLHAPSVLQWFEELATLDVVGIDHQIKEDKITIIRSILSISLADRRQMINCSGETPSIPSVLVFTSINAAIQAVHAQLITPPTMATLQATVAVQVFLVSMLHHNAASRIGGLIIRMAQQIGLHRCPARYSTFSKEEVLLRKRLFWTIYSIDRHISQSLGLPLGIRDDDFDVCFLNSENHSKSHEFVMDGRLAICNFVSRLSGVKGRTLELRNKSISHRQSDSDIATLVSSDIAKISNDIEEYTAASTQNVTLSATSHLVVLEVMKQECIIALNRPLLTMSKESSDYKMGVQLCIGASRSIITQLTNSLKATTGTDSDSYQSAPLLWPSFTWAVWMSAFVIIYAAMEGEMSVVAARRLSAQCIDILKHLSLRGTVWPGACAAAVGDLSKRFGQENGTPEEFKGVSASTRGDSHRSPSYIQRKYGQQIPMSQNSINQHPGEPGTLRPYLRDAQDDSQQISRVSHQDNWASSSGFQASVDDSFGGFTSPVDRIEANPFDGFDIPFWMNLDQITTGGLEEWDGVL